MNDCVFPYACSYVQNGGTLSVGEIACLASFNKTGGYFRISRFLDFGVHVTLSCGLY